ncbi:YjcQ family protein [Clostridium boliviensis]|uniref:YjcQ family protein n=1 Tax=Clostridium boliviensis TaxID=318465 RepID=A0ABU4GSB7_9CLOT|nr:YjcQ family protein [Clostridium boliviensis]MDW2799882.1 YjcQ family protein [Clostridium boliviensis]
MDFDSKQKVLVAIYMEYQKDIPDMEQITAASVGMEKKVFLTSLEKLENESLIRGIKFIRGGGETLMAHMVHTMMTPYGLNYVENKLNIQPEKSGLEKMKDISQKTAAWGWNEAKDFAAKVVSEIIQSQANK